MKSKSILTNDMESFHCKLCYFHDIDPFSTTATVPEPTIKPNYLFYKERLVFNLIKEIYDILLPPHKLENTVLQLCKFKDNQLDYGPFLDFDLTIQDQIDDLDGYLESGHNGIIMRTKLSIRVEALIERITNSNGKELKKALFSLKQIFQDDKDLVQEFVARHGLHCLRQIGSKSDQNHQNYILRALGQLMLYVDGMNGVLEDSGTLEWLYSLLQGKFRLVVKLALKLLVVFIEYAKEPTLHASVIISSINKYHQVAGGRPWSLVVKIMADDEANDSELVTYAITFINKVLSSLPDQDTFYDVTDLLEEQGMEEITNYILNKPKADLDMVKQFKIYEVALKIEDGEGLLNTINEGVRYLPRAKSETKLDGPRKSKRTQGGIPNSKSDHTRNQKIIIDDQRKIMPKVHLETDMVSRGADKENSDVDEQNMDDSFKNNVNFDEFDEDDNILNNVRRRKIISKEQRLERFKSLGNLYQGKHSDTPFNRMTSSPPSRPQSLLIEHNENSLFHENALNTVSEQICSESEDISVSIKPEIRVQSDSKDSSPTTMSPVINHDSTSFSPDSDNVFSKEDSFKMNGDISKQTVKTMKNQFITKTKQPTDTPKVQVIPTGDVSGIISSAKDNLQTSKVKPQSDAKVAEIKKTPANVSTLTFEYPDWEQLEKEISRSKIHYDDWDFSDLIPSEDQVDSKEHEKQSSEPGIPLPPPPPSMNSFVVPPSPGLPRPPPAPTSMKLQSKSELSKSMGSGLSKQKRTTRLHWRVLPSAMCSGDGSTIWSKMKAVDIDTEKFESLFENKPHDMKKDVKQESGPKKLEVLDVKRSNAINIGMKNLVPMDSMKHGILNMTSSVVTREGVEKLLKTMLPTQEEIDNIKSAQLANKDAQLGQAEKFLLDLSEINLLEARLEVWLFQLDFDQIERDILESIMDLKSGVNEIYKSDTLVCVLSTLLKIGNFLNETSVSAFSLEYLQKVPDLKDTKHKQSLLYHVVTLIVSQYPQSTDLHSDLSALNRCHRVDWEELAKKLEKVEMECKRLWDYFKLIFKSDQSLLDNVKKLREFYGVAQKRIVKMKVIYRRVMQKYDKVLQYLGFTSRDAKELNVRYFCKIMSDFAIEYRTVREKIMQVNEKKEKDKQRKKTRGAMIADINSLERYNRAKSQTDNSDFLDVIMSRTNVGEGENDFNSLNNRRQRRISNQPFVDKNRTYPRQSYSHQIHNQNSSPIASNMTPASSELALDQSDHLLDQLAHQATASGKRRTTRRLAGARERKSMRRSKPLTDDIIKCLDQLKSSPTN